MRTVLLLTSTIRVNEGVKYTGFRKDEFKRLSDYNKSLDSLSNSIGLTDIVYVDNSGYNESSIKCMLRYESLWSKNIEFSVVTIPPNTNHSKGVGEYELILAGVKYIKENIIDDNDDIFVIKLSGRINIDKLDASLFVRKYFYIPFNFSESNFSERFKYLTFAFAGPLETLHSMINKPLCKSKRQICYETFFEKLINKHVSNPMDFPYFKIIDTVIAGNGKPYKLNPNNKL